MQLSKVWNKTFISILLIKIQCKIIKNLDKPCIDHNVYTVYIYINILLNDENIRKQ